eukprot:TRINITY_DN6497_c0_g1_i1.p1 TRINITY_DN6497_c0_g1~~TRINITY_DN6497_c0_g1_i1.p1  ORF type:complete len:701 (+),score=136.25 TRINITY_DN6497_c0_g1_i1:1272-3374(+)
MDLPPQVIVPNTEEWCFEDLDAIEIARQITLMQETLILKITEAEFIAGGWYAKENGMDLSPNIIQLIEQSNVLTNWLSTEIVKHLTNESRGEAITKCITMARTFRELNNFFGVIIVLSCLHSAPIGKLKKSWEHVPKKSKETFNKLTLLMDNQGHYRNYTKSINQLHNEVPCIPLISIVCQDIFKIEDSMDNFSKEPEGWIQWSKMSQLAKQIREIKRFNSVYNLNPVTKIQRYIRNAEIWDPEMIYQIAAIQNNLESDLPLTKIYSNTSDFWSDYQFTEYDITYIFDNSEQPLRYNSNEIIVSKDHSNFHMYIISSGTVNLVKTQEAVDPIISLGRGHMFGIESMIIEQLVGTGISYYVAGEEAVALDRVDFEIINNICGIRSKYIGKLSYSVVIMLSNLLKNSSIDENSTSINNSGNTSITNTGNTGDNEQQARMKKIFQTDEILIREIPCTLKKRVAHQGSLFVTKNSLWFYSNSFVKVKVSIPMQDIMLIEMRKKKLKFKTLAKDSTYILSGFNDIKTTHELLVSTWKRCNSKRKKKRQAVYTISRGYIDDSNIDQTEVYDISGLRSVTQWELTEDDWELLLKGSQSTTYNVGDSILVEGEMSEKIFVVSKGMCKIEKEEIGILGYLNESEIFGEISLLNKCPVTASVIVEEECTVNAIDAYYLNNLFQYFEGLSARFFYFLIENLFVRLKNRDII